MELQHQISSKSIQYSLRWNMRTDSWWHHFNSRLYWGTW